MLLLILVCLVHVYQNSCSNATVDTGVPGTRLS
jgi:hypothetical protein